MPWDEMRAIPTPNMTYESVHTLPQEGRYASASAGSGVYDKAVPGHLGRRVSGLSHQSRGISGGNTLSTVSGPSIFIPGTTITKEDIDIMTMRYEAEIEQLKIEANEMQIDLTEQAGLVRELTQELDMNKSRETRLRNETMQKDQSKSEYEKQVAALSALLEASEKELVTRGKTQEAAVKENVELKSKLSAAEADLQTESKEADMLRTKVQQLEGQLRQQEAEIGNVRAVLDSQQEETAMLSRANGLYKATHTRYVKEGQLASQLAETVEALKREVSESESRLTNFQKDKSAETKTLLREQQDEIGSLLALSCTVEELTATTSTATIKVNNTEEWQRCVEQLREIANANHDAINTPHLKMLAAMTEGGTSGSGINLVALKKEIEAIQSSGANKDNSRTYYDNMKIAYQATRQLLRILTQEIRSACSSHAQQLREVEHLSEEVSTTKAQHDPLVTQLQRLGDQLNHQQQEVGLKQALLEKEQVNHSKQLEAAANDFSKEEECLKSRLEEAHTENERMKTFMAKLQIADVPQLHSLLATAASTSRKTRPTPAPHSSLASMQSRRSSQSG
eukprot:TRINITY_DN37276_c0_g1_i1.p1 TRINITY_DN37276_c0_g1~~TRINITY_DN37276_c0_g1_i1.p1  ORF type:complete len:567 (+),score=155.99 TRINITY_DN37276_c0_g1_i1:37-1737(+)